MKVASNTAKLLQHVPLPDEIGEVRTNTAVIDIGSYLTRIGFSGDNYPRLLQRTSDVLHTDSHTLHNGSIDKYSVNDRCNANNTYVDKFDQNVNNKNSNHYSSSWSNEVNDVQLMHNGNIVDYDRYE